MKNQRTLLIEQAARDDADEGTEWMTRLDRWMDELFFERLSTETGLSLNEVKPLIPFRRDL